MNNFVLLCLGVVILFLVMNGSKGNGKSKSMSGSLSKSVNKALKGNGALILLGMGAVVLFMCMNKNMVEGLDDGGWCKKTYGRRDQQYLNRCKHCYDHIISPTLCSRQTKTSKG